MQKTSENIDLVVFIDAFGWEILKKNQFLEDKLSFRKPLNTVFGYSSTCIPTILSGTMPQEHEHFSFFYYQPDTSPFGMMRYLKYLPAEITRRGRVRRYMSRFIKRLYGYTGYFQIYNMPFEHLSLFDYSEKHDLYASGGINSGAKTFLDILREQKIPFSLSDWRASEDANMQKVHTDISTGTPRLAYVYLAGLDGIIHEYGTTSAQSKEKIRWYDTQLRRLLEIAESKYQNVNLTVFSDHGQADIHTQLDLIRIVQDRLPLTFGKDYVAVYDSTMARFWALKPGVENQIKSVLQEQTQGRLLSDAQLAKLECNFSGNKYGEIFFVANPGVLICPSFLGDKPLAAMHGYLPDDKDSIAMVASNHDIDTPPKRLDDMYEYILNQVGLPKELCTPAR